MSPLRAPLITIFHQKKRPPAGGAAISCYPRRVSAFLVQLTYFAALSLVGYLILNLLRQKTEFRPRKIDLLFTAVSAATVSSMSTVEIEAFSDEQLMVLAVLMFLGGEIIVSLVGLILRNLKNEVEDSDYRDFESDSDDMESYYILQNPFIEDDAIDFLISSIWRYILLVHIVGVASLFFYLALEKSAGEVLRNKGLNTSTFAVFTVISTFSNCGFVPTNENLVAFRGNSGLLWILMPQVLLGNSLFPFFLRILLRFHGNRTRKEEADYLLQNANKVGFFHLLPPLHALFLGATVSAFVLVGFLLFFWLEWDSPVFFGLTLYQKLVCILSECVNARFTGETVLDLSKITPALLVFFLVMMYLPPYTSFLPIGEEEKEKENKGTTENLCFSQLSYLAIFVILICITERKSLDSDPINFNVLNVAFEVISAYGNVGFTTGYSCGRRLVRDGRCVERWYGFAGSWSDEGKMVLMVVMFVGRLKQFNLRGGRAWKLM